MGFKWDSNVLYLRSAEVPEHAHHSVLLVFLLLFHRILHLHPVNLMVQILLTKRYKTLWSGFHKLSNRAVIECALRHTLITWPSSVPHAEH